MERIFYLILWTWFVFRCDSVEKLKHKLPALDKEILDSNKFKDFYQFTFNYAKNPGQKGLDLDMALAYWNIVLTGRFQFLDIWSRFLKVSVLKWIYLKMNQNNIFRKSIFNYAIIIRLINFLILGKSQAVDSKRYVESIIRFCHDRKCWYDQLRRRGCLAGSYWWLCRVCKTFTVETMLTGVFHEAIQNSHLTKPKAIFNQNRGLQS